MIPYIQTNKAIIIHWNDGTPHMVDKEHKNYEAICELVMNTPSASDEFYEELEEMISVIHKLVKMAETSNGSLSVTESGVMTFHDVNDTEFTVPQTLAHDIIAIHDVNGNLEPFINFLDKLSRNPDYRVVNQLWGFIKSCGLCLTVDGNFMAYKNVNTDFTSPYDDKTDNSPGTTLTMLRNQVDNDPNRTCSSGLHFAAWGYLSHYAPGRKTVLLSISPEDVVSIPVDYNNQKGRACRYTVVREVEQPEELKNITIFDESDGYDDYDDDSYDDYEYCSDCDGYVDDYGVCDCDEI